MSFFDVSVRLLSIFLLVFSAALVSACTTSEPLSEQSVEAAEDRAHASDSVELFPEPAPIQAGIAPGPGPYAPGFDALHYEIAITLPDTGSTIRGETTAHVLVESPRRDTLFLDLSGLAVSSVRSEGSALDYRYREGKLHIPVPAVLEPGDTMRAEIAYHGEPDDGLIIGTNIHGEPTAFADNWPNRARFWFPSIDHPSDKASVSFAVEAPSGRQVIANGAQQDEDSPSVLRWVNPEPIPTYTMVIGAADFAIERLGSVCQAEDEACAEVTTWFFPHDAETAAPSFRRAADMLAYYSRLIAPYPYSKLAHVQSSTRFGGMENVTAIFYPEEALSEGIDIETTVAHETAHQWFGDAVTESDWHHLWLSEGFAEYFAALYFEEADGVERFREIMDEYRASYLMSDVVHRPIVDPEEDNLFQLLNANNYYKGAWVLHMLRTQLGDSSFFEGIRQYYRMFEHGTVLTDDLRRSLEAESGEDLNAFFDQWVFEPGFPRIDVEWTWDAATSSATVRIDQVQSEEWPDFNAPLVLAFQTDDGPVVVHAALSDRDTVVDFELSAEPMSLEIDPERDLLIEVVEVRRVGR